MIEVIEEATGETLKQFHGLADAKSYATARWPGCWFDGDPDLGARDIYVYADEDSDAVLGHILLPRAGR